MRAGRHLEEAIEDFAPFILDAHPVEHDAAIDIDILAHMLVDGAVGGEFQRGRRLAAIGGAPPGGKRQKIGAARDLARGGNRVIAGRVHEDEALFRHRLGIAIDGLKRR